MVDTVNDTTPDAEDIAEEEGGSGMPMPAEGGDTDEAETDDDDDDDDMDDDDMDDDDDDAIDKDDAEGATETQA